MPDPRAAADAYADAASRGDADAIYDMLDEDARRALTREDVRKLVADQRKELADQAKAIRSTEARVQASARIRFADGEDAVLDLSENGHFLVASADALPAGARTPTQALDQLRRVLARRSYAGLLRVLSTPTRSAMENDLRSLVEGLENPEELDVQQSGETATVRVPGGHLILLRREGGTWRIDDID
jgi:predicted  nucleic acid-binding Zn-ribbon protein